MLIAIYSFEFEMANTMINNRKKVTSMTNLDKIKKTLVNISKGEGMLDMLIEFERTLDNAELFSYRNWILGEIVDGPHISRYWFKVTLMYPEKMMPDPDAGLRLIKIGAKVSFRKGTFHKPVKVRGPADWADPESKRAKMAEHKVWLVDIDMPLKYINRGIERNDDIIQNDIDKMNAELAGAFDDGLPEDTMDMTDDMSTETVPGIGEEPVMPQQGGV